MTWPRASARGIPPSHSRTSLSTKRRWPPDRPRLSCPLGSGADGFLAGPAGELARILPVRKPRARFAPQVGPDVPVGHFAGGVLSTACHETREGGPPRGLAHGVVAQVGAPRGAIAGVGARR